MRLPQNWRSAPVTIAIAAVTGLAWLVVAALGLDYQAAMWGGFIPARIDPAGGAAALVPVLLTPLTATLVHGGLMHVAFNLIFLLFCGRSVEPILGSRGLLILYLVGAYVGAGAQYLIDPHSAVPMIGASGAISAVLGAYAMLFGKNRVKVANPTLALWLHVLWLAAAWIGLQLLVGFAFTPGGEGIAVAAHIGGFIAGLALAKPLLLLKWRGA
ncbi:MAG: rhomboid family intrarane serine protease [Alphaproteobacteria bacterium]|nr:rhomboid family intrarane serine protease [Alphaproteobacteria bacterium]